jgi:hypothetical protein
LAVNWTRTGNIYSRFPKKRFNESFGPTSSIDAEDIKARIRGVAVFIPGYDLPVIGRIGANRYMVKKLIL